MFLSGSAIASTSTGATWISRHKSLLPYHPAPINPTLRGLFTTSSASAPNDGNAAIAAAAEAVFRNSRRLTLNPPIELSLFESIFIFKSSFLLRPHVLDAHHL